MSNHAADSFIHRTSKDSDGDLTRTDGALDQFLKIGRFLLALPMLVFPVFHFIATTFVATIVPPWIPWHVFWTYFCGVTIMGAGALIVFKKHARVPAILLGIEIFLFVMLIHVFLIFHKPGDPWAAHLLVEGPAGELNNCFKDLGLSGAVFIFAGTLSESWRTSGRDNILALGRTIVAVCIIAFSVLHFIYPAFAPGIQPMFESIAFPIPGHLSWVYLTGAALLLAGVCMLINWQTRLAATFVGILILVFDLLTWGPRFPAHPGELAGNWLKDLGVAGGVLILAGSLPKESLANSWRNLESQFIKGGRE